MRALQTWIDSELIRLDWSDSESATKTRSILISSLRWSMNRTSNATRVVGRNWNSESATKADNDWSCHRARHSKWVCYNDKSIVDLLIESVIEQKTSSIECNRHERNKLYYMRVVDTNETTLLHACSRHESEDTSWSLNWVDQRTEQVLLHTCSRQKSK